MESGKTRAENILNLMEQKASLKQMITGIQAGIKKAINGFTEEELEDMDYDTLKKIYDNEQYSITDPTIGIFRKVMETKRMEKYPQLKKPVYFPEIDSLDISDAEKLRLDKAARKNRKFYMSEDSLKWNEFGLSLEDLELLVSIGVAKRMYEFRCPDCGDKCIVVPEEDMEIHKRVWELEKIKSPSKDEIEELDRIQYDYGCICLECMDCGIEYEITNEKEFHNFEKYMKVIYRIAKKPDLSSEKL